MRLELTEFGIKVTNIQPGAVETDFSLVRFKGDSEKAATVYSGYEPLKAEDIADAIAYCINARSMLPLQIYVFIRALRQNQGQSIKNSLKIKD